MSKEKIERPQREPDLISKRGVPYWFSPDWVRATSSAAVSFGRIADQGDRLYMVSKEGTTSYIQGSIQHEYARWLENRINYFFLPEEETHELVDLTKRRR